MPEIMTVEEWLGVITRSMDEFCRSSLGYTGCQSLQRDKRAPEGENVAAYIPLMDETCAIQIGLVAAPETGKILAKRLLQMEEQEEISLEDMADSIREIVNIIAGMSKLKLKAGVHPPKLGLPIFVNGFVKTSAEVEIAVQTIQLGEVQAHLVVLQGI